MMKRLPVNLWNRQHDEIKKIAFKENTSMSDIVRDAVDDYLKKKGLRILWWNDPWCNLIYKSDSVVERQKLMW